MAIPKQGPVIAIDGPAGTGKSSVTRRLAEELGFIHVDTGALYRAIAYLTLRQSSLDSRTFEKEVEIAIPLSRSVHLEFRRMIGKDPVNRIFGDGQDLTDVIRSPEVSMASSRVSAIPEVRAGLLGLQRRLGCAGHTILEGRDIGTVIFPDADLKFYLTASVEVRAKRRLIELEASGKDAPSFATVKSQIEERDRSDSTRSVAPLRKAMDAVEVDTSQMTLDEVVDSMASISRKRLKLGLLDESFSRQT